MSRLIELKPINEIIAAIQAEAEKDIQQIVESMRKQTADTIRRIELNRQAAALLDAAGFDLDLPWYVSGAYLTLDLGFFPQNRKGNMALAEKLRLVRNTLGDPLGAPSKGLSSDQKRMEYSYTPEAWPGLTVKFSRRLPKPKPGQQLKCKVVTHRSTYKTLVCER